MLISLIHPSRGRAYKAFNTAWNWIDRAGVKVDYVIGLDLSDPQRDEYSERFLTKRKAIADNKSVVEATNNAAKEAKGEILVYLSDDFGCPENWGIDIEAHFDGVQTPMLLKVDDCLQKFDIRVLTIPIMNRQLYNLLGYFFNPLYKSMFVDCDLYEVCDKLQVIRKAPYLKFPHEHHSLGMCDNDEIYKRSEANWKQGMNVFNARKRHGFTV